MGKATDNRRPSTIIRDNHVHDLYDKIMCDLGELRNVVAKSYIYRKIREQTGLSEKTIESIINHTRKV